MPNTSKTLAVCAVVALLGMAPQAQAVQTAESLIDAARTAAEAAARAAGVKNSSAIVAKPDSRLRLDDCPAPLDARLASQTRLPGRAVVRVSCPVAPGWSVHLPVQVEAAGNVLVAARPLPRGHRIEATDLQRQPAQLGTLGGQYLLSDSAAVGQALKLSVRAGERLTPAMLQAPVLVRRGDPVMLQVRSDGFVIRSAGTAMGNGAAGERVSVQNPGTRRVVRGTVTGEGQVTVEF